jgi:uncharacterized protein YxjI
MRYQMKQKVWSWGDRFAIKNEHGQDVAFIDGKVFSIGDQLTFTDAAGNELAAIRQKVMSWGPTYEIYRGGELAAVVKQKLWAMKPTFTVDVPGPDDLTARGNWTAMEYSFERGGVEVARVSKAWFAWADTYGVEVVDTEDAVLILAATVVIDLVSSAET